MRTGFSLAEASHPWQTPAVHTQNTIGWLQDRLRSSHLSPGELVEAAIAAHRPDWKAYVSFDADRARAQAALLDRIPEGARDPLHGLPFSVKDLFVAPPFPTYAGSPKALPDGLFAPSPLVRRLTEAGAVLMGKTQTVEFAFGGLGQNPHWGTPKNPWSPGETRVCGGSSAGAGLSLLEGSAVFALGTDTLGSVRIPASMTGTVGLKTTHGLWPMQGIVPLSPALDTAGLLAREMNDLILVYTRIEALLGRSVSVDRECRLKRLHVVVPKLLLKDVDPSVRAVFDDALAALDATGAQVTQLEIPELEAALALFERGVTSAPDLVSFLRAELPDWIPSLDPRVAERCRAAGDLSALDYLARGREMHRLQQAITRRLDGAVLLSPTVAIGVPRLAELSDPEGYSKLNLLALRNPGLMSILGLCALSLPIGLDAHGMPVGLQVALPGREEEMLLGLGLALENHLGNAKTRLGSLPESPSAA